MQELNERIKMRGLKKSYIAEVLGVTTQALWKKLSGKSPFTVEEAIVMKELLNLTEKEFFHFFCSKS